MDMNMQLLMQYLSNAGSAMGQGQNIAPALNEVTQQALGAQSKAKMIQQFAKMLQGEYPEGSKWSTDAKGDTLTIPKSLMTEGGEVEAGTGNVSEAVPKEGVKELINNIKASGSGGMGAANPFVIGQLGEIDMSNLAGLSSQDISQALSDAGGAASLRQQSINSVTDRMYKRALTQQVMQSMLPEGAEQPFVQSVPGYGDLTLDEYKALPTSDREYVSHVLASREIGEEPMSREEFDKVEDKDRIPSTAMGAAITRHMDETGELPPPEVLANWADMFREEDKPREPSPVTWTTATKELTKRFGKLDPTGFWAVTPELQGAHSRAQEYLTEFKSQGIEPLVAVNMAAKKARNWQSKVEEKYNEYINRAREIPDKKKREAEIEKIRNQFKKTYGYLP